VPKQPKLSRIREWLTVDEAARYLALMFEEQVARADVLRAALDGHLKLSVRFVNHAYAKIASPPRTPEELEELHRHFNERMAELKSARESGAPVPPPRQRARPGESGVFVLNDTTIFDLPLVGGERLDVEHEYQRLTGGPEVTLINIDGTFVETGDGTRLQLQERAPSKIHTKDGPVKVNLDYIPAGTLPHDAVFVVRRDALEAFVDHISGQGRPVGKRERENYLAVMAALCQLPRQDRTKPTKTAKIISDETDRLGHEVSERTVLDYLEAIRELLPEA
jgi:hypothetical protein